MNIDKNKKNEIAIQNLSPEVVEEFNRTIEELKDLVTEKSFSAQWELIEMYHMVGKKIDTFAQRAKVDTSLLIKIVSTKLNKSRSTVSRAVQFYKKFPDLNTAPFGKNISWHKIVNEYLPASKEEQKVLPDITIVIISREYLRYPIYKSTSEGNNYIWCTALSVNSETDHAGKMLLFFSKHPQEDMLPVIKNSFPLPVIDIEYAKQEIAKLEAKYDLEVLSIYKSSNTRYKIQNQEALASSRTA